MVSIEKNEAKDKLNWYKKLWEVCAFISWIIIIIVFVHLYFYGFTLTHVILFIIFGILSIIFSFGIVNNVNALNELYNSFNEYNEYNKKGIYTLSWEDK